MSDRKTPGVYVTELYHNEVAPLPAQSIEKSITEIAKYLNQYLKAKFGLPEDMALVSNIMNLDGSVAQQTGNKVVLQLFHLGRGKLLTNLATAGDTEIGLMVSANFSEHLEAIKIIGEVAQFFRLADWNGQATFTSSGSPIAMQQLDLGIAETAAVFGMMGLGYLPSLFYTLRLPQSKAEETFPEPGTAVAEVKQQLEEGIKRICQSFVFEGNHYPTWLALRSQVNVYLQRYWESGFFEASTPENAFKVSVGLGETMTAEDVLNGYMNLSVVLNNLKGVEDFLLITFQQEMVQQ